MAIFLLREAVVSERLVDTAYNGSFATYGILEFNADDLRKTGLVFEYEDDPQWGTDAHFLLRRVGGTNSQPKLQRLNNTQKGKLKQLATSRPLRRNPF